MRRAVVSKEEHDGRERRSGDEQRLLVDRGREGHSSGHPGLPPKDHPARDHEHVPRDVAAEQ